MSFLHHRNEIFIVLLSLYYYYLLQVHVATLFNFSGTLFCIIFHMPQGSLLESFYRQTHSFQPFHGLVLEPSHPKILLKQFLKKLLSSFSFLQ